MTWRSSVSLSAALLVAALSVQLAHAGNTTCVSKQLDWYTNVVGESPCMTYQRLRQICNNDYQVSAFSSGAVPGDRCNDQVSACCCNTIAFQLSMLCLNCQRDTQDTGGSGFDAGVGAFHVYTSSCSPALNHTLPNDVQHAVCNENIRLDNYLYAGWNDGSWFYVFTKETAERTHAANNNNTFTHCPNQISPSSTPTPTSHASGTIATTRPTSPGRSAISASSPGISTQTSNADSESSGQSHSTSREGLIGGVVGGVLGFTIIVLAVILWMRRRPGRKGSQWIQNPRFGFMYSGTTASASGPKGSLAPSKFSTAGPLSSRFSYSDYPSGTSATSPGTRSKPYHAFRPPLPPAETSLRHDDKSSLYPLSRSDSGIFSNAYDTSSQDTDRPTEPTRPHSDAAPSVSLSAFDFMGSQIHDDGRTMRSFPLSATTDEFVASSEPPTSGTRAPNNAPRIGTEDSEPRGTNPYRS